MKGFQWGHASGTLEHQQLHSTLGNVPCDGVQSDPSGYWIHHNYVLSFLISAGTTTSATKTGNTTLFPKGIAGWEEIGQLAEELLSLADIAVSTAQAEKLKVLHNTLELYDKKAIKVHSDCKI